MAQISTIQLSDIKNAHRFDAEYFKPEYLEIERNLNIKNSLELEKLLQKNIICGPFGSAILTSDYKEKWLPLLRVLNLHNFFLDTTDLKYISYEKSNNLSRYFVKQWDIVVSQRWSVAEFSLIEDEWNYIISANLISIKNNNSLNFHYLITFLNSKYWKKQLEKKITWQVQEKITTIDIKTLKIPLLPESFQLEIEKIVKEAYEKQKLSKKLYKEAEQILLEELDLVDYKPKHKLIFETSAKEIEQAHRFDAEFFQPKYKDIIEKIESYEGGFDIVKNIFDWKKWIEVWTNAYSEKWKNFVRVSDFSKYWIENVSRKISEEYFEKIKDDYQAKKWEILFTKDWTIGITYLLENDIDWVLSSAFLRLILKEKYENYKKECFTLILNSILSKLQVKQLSGWAIIAHLKPSDFEKFKIPLLKSEIQEKIAEKVNLSHKLRKESKDLLEEAKRRVEEEIEK